jgi:hypothetical protein
VADNTLVRRLKIFSEGSAAFFSGIFFLSGIFLFSLLTLKPRSSRPQSRRLHTEWSWRPCRCASLNAFFFRPPPRLGPVTSF